MSPPSKAAERKPWPKCQPQKIWERAVRVSDPPPTNHPTPRVSVQSWPCIAIGGAFTTHRDASICLKNPGLNHKMKGGCPKTGSGEAGAGLGVAGTTGCALGGPSRARRARRSCTSRRACSAFSAVGRGLEEGCLGHFHLLVKYILWNPALPEVFLWVQHKGPWGSCRPADTHLDIWLSHRFSLPFSPDHLNASSAA